MKAPTQYLVLHRSCSSLPGVLACQAAHAAAESIRELPVSDATIVCALVAETSAQLEDLHAALEAARVEHVIIREPDPPYSGAATAVGIAPMDRALVREFVAHFKVLR